MISWTLADPRGAPGMCAPPGGPNSFIFMQFLAKIIAILGVGAPPGENPGSATAGDKSCQINDRNVISKIIFGL